MELVIMGISASIVTDNALDYRSSIPSRYKMLLLAPASRPALGPTQPPIQWVPGALSTGVKRLGRELTSHNHVVPRSRKSEAVPPLPHTSSWHSA
jgi:hypothetical protein